MKFKNLNCDETQTQNMTKIKMQLLKKSKCDKNSITQNDNSKCDTTKKL